MEIVVLTCEVKDVGYNIKATLKRNGKTLIKFNAGTKYIETLEEELDKVIKEIDWKGLLQENKVQEKGRRIKNEIKTT